MQAYQAARAGVQLVPEDRRIIPGLTVEENLILAQIAEPIGWPLERIYEHFPRLAERRRQEATTLSGGEQQMLAVARALAREVKLLLLDEPYEGLAPLIVREIESIVDEIKELGITTDHRRAERHRRAHLADRAIILDMGEIVFDGSAQQSARRRRAAAPVSRHLIRVRIARQPAGAPGRTLTTAARPAAGPARPAAARQQRALGQERMNGQRPAQHRLGRPHPGPGA